MDKKIKLELSVEEMNVILLALAKRPLEEVVNLFSKLKVEAEGQLRPVEEKKEE